MLISVTNRLVVYPTLFVQLHISRNSLRKIKITAILNGSEYKSSGHAAHVVDNVIGCLFAERQNWTDGHNVFFAFGQHLFKDTLLGKAENQALQM